MWNVNEGIEITQSRAGKSFILTMWNVNETYIPTNIRTCKVLY